MILRGLAALSVACALLCGCAGGAAVSENGPGMMRAGGPSPQAASQSIAMGRSTKAEVAAALGKAAVVRFDSGYEVWVYRWPGPDRASRSATELVVLFDPSGTVKKTRVRPG
jgi:hypothetical protein